MDGKIYHGNKLDFKIKEKIGHGGNGDVKNINIIKPKSYNGEFVVKIFKPKSSKQYDIEKRFIRFNREIDTIFKIQDNIQGILPIEDYYLAEKYDENNPSWYVMPKANDFEDIIIKDKLKLDNKINYLTDICNIIIKLHNMGYVHRDIKPKNLLLKDGIIFLADYGLVWKDDFEPITEDGEKVGAYTFIAPEMMRMDDSLKDQKPADIYSFAKIVWCVLTGEVYGFYGQYSRIRSNIYLQNKAYKVDTFEPIHRLLEEATIDNPAIRINIEKCLEYLSTFKACLDGNTIIQKKCIRQEIDKEIDVMYKPTELRYENLTDIVSIIDKLKNDYKICENAYISEFKIDKCEKCNDGMVLHSIMYNGLVVKKLLCFPESFICRNNEVGDNEYIIKIIRISSKDMLFSEYREYRDISDKHSGLELEEPEKKILLNQNMILVFRAI